MKILGFKYQQNRTINEEFNFFEGRGAWRGNVEKRAAMLGKKRRRPISGSLDSTNLFLHIIFLDEIFHPFLISKTPLRRDESFPKQYIFFNYYEFREVTDFR